MTPTENVTRHLGFPDVSLSIPYTEALNYAQERLKVFVRGELKPFCEQHKLPYTVVVNLKNGNLKNEEPRLLQRVLRGLGIATELIRVPSNNKSQRFLFPDQPTLKAFQAELETFKANLPPTD